MNHHKQFFGALFGGLISWITDHGHDIISGIAFYGGAVVVVLSGISWCWDIYNKWRHRKD